MSANHTTARTPAPGLSDFAIDSTLRRALESSEVLADLDGPELDYLAAQLRIYRLPANGTLFREGEHAGYMGILLQGRLTVEKRADDNKGHALYTMTPGKIFGEMALLDGEPRSATLKATEASLVVTLSREAFEQLCLHKPAIALKIMLKIGRLLSQRLRRASGLLVDHLP